MNVRFTTDSAHLAECFKDTVLRNRFGHLTVEAEAVFVLELSVSPLLTTLASPASHPIVVVPLPRALLPLTVLSCSPSSFL